MDKKDAKFMAWNWDYGKFQLLPSNEIAEAINIAWNYEFDVYERETEDLIFSGNDDNEGNNDRLKKYGIQVIDDGKHRNLQNLETGEIYKPDWQK
ncbi:hypothetical protein [Terribacillus sp. JSM ZJ617]|uniref:hypothetical protein n=1 Tax=Terribacillus sp. JSM ZJ617 TaxID=3342119 RepID=UPI0035A871EB